MGKSIEIQDKTVGPMTKLVDIATVAEYLGVSVRYVRRLVSDGEIPFIKCRRLLRFDLDVIASWVDQNRHGEEGLRAQRRAG